MRYNQLGRTGLFVSELCLGTMTFGGEGKGIWGNIGTLEQEAVDSLMKRALDAGINFVDTADVYSEGHSEELLGQSLKNLGVKRSDVVIATKFYGGNGEGAERSRRLARPYHGCGGGESETPADRPHRSLPDPQLRPVTPIE